MSEINDLNETFEETMDESTVITVPIDDTLSNSGEAADAAAVGAALALKADASSVVTIDVNGNVADNQGHIEIDGSDIQMGGTDERTLKAAITFAEGRTAEDIPMSSDVGAQTIAEAVATAGAANATTIPMSADSTTTVAQQISAMNSTAAAQATAISNLQAKTAETILVKAGETETVKDALDARVKTVNGIGPDENGNAEVTTVQMAENLASSLSQTNQDTFTVRTSGGTTSIESGPAWLMNIKGNSTHEGYSAESLEMTVTEAGEAGHITAELDRDTFVEAVSGSGTTTLVSDGTNWSVSGTVTDPATYGVTVSGTPVDGDTISIVYVAEVRGTITPATPTAFTASGWNLYNNTDGCARVKKYSESYGYKISGSYTALKYSATYDGTRSDVTVTSGNFTVPGDGFVWVTGGDSTSTAIWATWSDWTEGYSGNFATYDESTVDLSSVMQTYFPNGLMKAGSVVDEINLNVSQAISRVERMAYSASNMATAKASGREYEYDDDYIYLARAEAVVNSISGLDGGYTANDHGLEWFVGTEIGVETSIIYGNNLKNKLERDVVMISSQTLTDAQKASARANIQAANDAVVRSKEWTPTSGATLLAYILSNVDTSHLPFSGIKTGSTSISDSPFGTKEFTILVTGCSERMTVCVQEYGGNGAEYFRKIATNSWSGSWVSPASRILYNTYSDLNDAIEKFNGIKYFCFESTASNKPKTYGGAGIYIGNNVYGLQIAFTNSSVGSKFLSVRSVSGVGTAEQAFGEWGDITVS